uniref:Uncharacterized protein n=1 Tax=Oryza rufipogon TaxID=4529 RepID=A0A0E0QZW4_ORYRU
MPLYKPISPRNAITPLVHTVKEEAACHSSPPVVSTLGTTPAADAPPPVTTAPAANAPPPGPPPPPGAAADHGREGAGVGVLGAELGPRALCVVARVSRRLRAVAERLLWRAAHRVRRCRGRMPRAHAVADARVPRHPPRRARAARRWRWPCRSTGS